MSEFLAHHCTMLNLLSIHTPNDTDRQFHTRQGHEEPRVHKSSAILWFIIASFDRRNFLSVIIFLSEKPLFDLTGFLFQ